MHRRSNLSMTASISTLRRLLPLVAAGFLLRALVPVGYMPATLGTGLLFELCHEGMPVEMMIALAGDEHAHHAHHGHHGNDSAAEGSCSIGHLLTLAMIDGVDSVDVAAEPAARPGTWPFIKSMSVVRRYSSPPRGPPHTQIPRISA